MGAPGSQGGGGFPLPAPPGRALAGGRDHTLPAPREKRCQLPGRASAGLWHPALPPDGGARAGENLSYRGGEKRALPNPLPHKTLARFVGS